MVISASASAKIRDIIIAVNIFGALEGFLPKAFMLAKLDAAKTAHGPSMLNTNIIMRARLRLNLAPLWLLPC